MRATVVGLGEVGVNVFKSMRSSAPDHYEICGVDIDEKKIESLKKENLNVSTTIQSPSDIFVICVYTSEDVIKVVSSLDYSGMPLVVVESTLKPGAEKTLKKIVVDENQSNLVIFPHRFNKNDTEHQIFNLKRLFAGATKQCADRGREFYKNFMADENLVETSMEYAVLSKVMENAYRFLEIAAAEEIKILCDNQNLDFDELRKCMNSKWNIEIKEARDGIYGNCLLKDTKIVDEYFKENALFSRAMKVDSEYKTKFKK